MSAAKFWPRESRNLIGPLTIELSTEVNCLRDLLTIFNAKEQVCRGKRVAQRYSRRSSMQIRFIQKALSTPVSGP